MRHRRSHAIPLACVLSVFAIGLSAPPAAAGSITVFDFDDFPANPPVFDDEINTTLYGCRGKAFCTNADVSDARDNAISSLSTTRNGIEAVFARPPKSFPAGVGVFPNLGGPGDDNYLNGGNIELTGDYIPYVADFSKDLLFAEVEVGLHDESMLGDFAFLELWSEPGATGTLIGRTQEEFTSDLSVVDLSIRTTKANAFRSMRFGVGFDMAGCESGCDRADERGEQGVVDDIGVQPVPEPRGVMLFAAGLLTAGLATRRSALSARLSG